MRLPITRYLWGVVGSADLLALDLTSDLGYTALFAVSLLSVGLYMEANEAALKDTVPSDLVAMLSQAASSGRNSVLDLAEGLIGGGFALGWPLADRSSDDAANVIDGRFVFFMQVVPQTDRAALAELLENDGEPERKSAGFPTCGTLTTASAGFSAVWTEGCAWLAAILNLGVSAALSTIIYLLSQSGAAPLRIG